MTVKKRRRHGFSTKSKGDFWFDDSAAEDWIWFIQNLCRHVKGEWYGRKIVLEPWQRFIIEETFGWKRHDSLIEEECTRQYRQLWLELPRKNGKSSLSAPLALGLLFIDGEPGAEIYSAAADKEQAAIVFDMAVEMRNQEPEIASRTLTYGARQGVKAGQSRSIVYPDASSFYRVLSADAYSKHGLNVHGMVVDEVHVQKTRDLIDTLHSATGARRQPLEIYITTAGKHKTTICGEKHDYAKEIIAGAAKDDTVLPFIYGMKRGDDWKSRKVWMRTNPNLGVSKKVEYMEQECRNAMHQPSYENTFRRLELNDWIGDSDQWLNMRRWDDCGKPLADLNGRRCIAGLDLASTEDLAALALLFPSDEMTVQTVKTKTPTGETVIKRFEVPTWFDVRMRFWIPKDNIQRRVEKGKVQYDAWVRDGWITATPGERIDYDQIRSDINAEGSDFYIDEIAIDRWNAIQLAGQLESDGFEVMLFGQGFASMSAPTKMLETLVMGKRLRHGGNPVLTWMAGNTVVRTDATDAKKPDKETSAEKIDGMVALIMAVGRHMARPIEEESIYDQGEEVMAV